jgi:hypothetical protein
VLAKKGFPHKWIDWVMQAMSRGRVVVNLNGKLGYFFRSYKGVRQSDPLSPFLFNLAVDVLPEILNKARRKGIVRG